MNRKQIIAITVLGIAALMLGCKPNANQNGNGEKPNPAKAKANPPKSRTISQKDVIGSYEDKDEDGHTYRYVFLKNGVSEHYYNGKKDDEGTWKISEDGEIYIEENRVEPDHPRVRYFVYRINSEGSITLIAAIRKDDGKRLDLPTEGQQTLKKIN